MTAVAARLIPWHRQHGRHDLPWQTPATAYRVWISEVMLQQTQVTTVIPYFERFVGRFPDVTALAAAPVDEVLHLWSGLGYYARARNLHRAAQTIVADFGGQFPQWYDDVLGLPGIGRSTAGAILALAFGQRHPILDGNAKRVLARYEAIPGWPGRSAVAKILWDAAERHTPEEHVAEYTQAIMDLGATLCTRRNPRCGDCPLQSDCAARAAGEQHDYPGRKPRATRRVREARMVLAVSPGGVLLERRPPSGIWGGLWGLPEIPENDTPQAWCFSRLGCKPMAVESWPVYRHSFTHFDLDITPLRLTVSATVVADDEDQLWYDPASPAEVGLAAPVTALLSKLG